MSVLGVALHAFVETCVLVRRQVGELEVQSSGVISAPFLSFEMSAGVVFFFFFFFERDEGVGIAVWDVACDTPLSFLPAVDRCGWQSGFGKELVHGILENLPCA